MIVFMSFDINIQWEPPLPSADPCLIHQDLCMLCHRRSIRVPFETYSGYKDRKSTRLNSSHVAISYAVFCLKKINVGGEPERLAAVQRDQPVAAIVRMRRVS